MSLQNSITVASLSPPDYTGTKIALLNTPYILNEPFMQNMPPLSLLYIAGFLEKRGHVPKIFTLDYNVRDNRLYYFGYDTKTLTNDLSEFGPDIIGITCPYSARWPFTQRLCAMLREQFPRVPIVIGGIHPTAFPDTALEQCDCDYAVLGEGEVTTALLAERLISGREIHDLDGLAYRHDGKIRVNPKTAFIDDLDSLPMPAYHLLDMDRLKHQCIKDTISQLKGMYFSLLTSRSCPNQCSYCNMFLAHGRKWRSRSPENVLAEVDHLVSTYDVDQFAIMDDNFTLSRKRTKMILNGLMKRGRPIRFLTPNGVSLKSLNEEIIGLMKKAGALEVSIAIESGSEFIRNEVYKKRIKTQQILDIVKAFKKHDLPCRAFYMVGAPQETDETVQSTIDIMKKIKTPGYINITTPYKGTQLYDTFREAYGLSENDLTFDSFLDIRLPIEKVSNYDQILRWRRKLQLANIFFSWSSIIFSTQYLNWNVLVRFWKGIMCPTKITRKGVEELMKRHIPCCYDDTPRQGPTARPAQTS